jgi:hypothetical protein
MFAIQVLPVGAGAPLCARRFLDCCHGASFGARPARLSGIVPPLFQAIITPWEREILMFNV